MYYSIFFSGVFYFFFTSSFGCVGPLLSSPCRTFRCVAQTLVAACVFSSCNKWALLPPKVDVPWPSSLIRDQTLFPCITRWIPNDWTTREDIFLEYFKTNLRHCIIPFVVVVVHWLSCVGLFMIPWTATHQASLSFTISQSLLKLMCIELVMLSNHFILCRPLLLPSVFPSITQHQGLFQGVGSLHRVAKVLELQPFQSIFRVDYL